MGLTGPLGVMPAAYTELLIERVRAKDTAGREFLDIFNHRMISLFYRAWEKYFFPREYEGADRDVVSRHLLDLVGLGTSALQNRQDLPDDALIFYSGILAQHPRSAAHGAAISRCGVRSADERCGAQPRDRSRPCRELRHLAGIDRCDDLRRDRPTPGRAIFHPAQYLPRGARGAPRAAAGSEPARPDLRNLAHAR